MGDIDVKIGINGFGRIGRLFARQVWLKNCARIVAINDPLLAPDAMVYLLKYDSVHGRFPIDVEVDGPHAIKVNGQSIPVSNEKDATKIPWRQHGAEYIAETSGHYISGELCQGHLQAGAKKVIISAPAKDEQTPTFVMGVNDCCYDPSMQVVSNASCTTNCMAPLAKLVNDSFGIEEALMSTIHAVTATQTCVDGASKKDFRAGRAYARSVIPASTGAAEAVVKTIPSLRGRMTGMAFRVPVENVSVLDLTCRLQRPLNSIEDLGQQIRAIENDQSSPLHGILGATNEPVVSCDFNGDERSCIVDLSACIVLNPHFVKLVAYYDNEWGYSARLLDCIMMMAKKDREGSGGKK